MPSPAASDALKRATDIVVSGAALIVLFVPLLLLALLVRATSPGPAIHWSKRVGRGNRLFVMPKFRTMRSDTPQVATHLMQDPAQWLTPIGGFLRRSSLDELPQLMSVLIGDMSLVGPRPALFNQDDLVALRTAAGVEALRPGLTGWAQVNGRDELPIPVKVGLDAEYLKRRSFGFDAKVLALTVARVLGARGVNRIAMSDPIGIYNWRRLDDRLTTSGQPTEAELADVRALGVDHVVNLGLHTHEKALRDEAASVAALGMTYVHIPVDFKNPTAADLSAFCDLMDALGDKTVHVHCIANYRVSAFLYRYRVDRLGWDREAARRDLDAVWTPDGPWQALVEG